MIVRRRFGYSLLSGLVGVFVLLVVHEAEAVRVQIEPPIKTRFPGDGILVHVLHPTDYFDDGNAGSKQVVIGLHKAALVLSHTHGDYSRSDDFGLKRATTHFGIQRGRCIFAVEKNPCRDVCYKSFRLADVDSLKANLDRADNVWAKGELDVSYNDPRSVSCDKFSIGEVKGSVAHLCLSLAGFPQPVGGSPKSEGEEGHRQPGQGDPNIIRASSATEIEPGSGINPQDVSATFMKGLLMLPLLVGGFALVDRLAGRKKDRSKRD